MQNLWFFYALITSVIWGLGYVLSEKVLKAGVSPSFLMFLYTAFATPVFLAFSYYSKSLKSSMTAILNDGQIMFYFICVVVLFTIANILIFKSVVLKNATLASLVEITYPLFTVIFSFLFFKEFHLNHLTMAGTFCIFLGVGLIYLNG